MFVTGNPGFSTKGSHLQAATKAMDKCFEAIAIDFNTDDPSSAPSQLLNLCNGFFTNAMAASDPRRLQASMRKHVYDLRAKISEFGNLGETNNERLDRDSGEDAPWPQLTKVRIATVAMKSIRIRNMEDNPMASNDKMNSVMIRAEKLFADCSAIVLAKQKKIMNDAAADLQPIATGSTDGTDWLDPLPKLATNDQVQNHFTNTLATQDMSIIKQKATSLLQACGVHSGRVNLSPR